MRKWMPMWMRIRNARGREEKNIPVPEIGWWAGNLWHRAVQARGWTSAVLVEIGGWILVWVSGGYLGTGSRKGGKEMIEWIEWDESR